MSHYVEEDDGHISPQGNRVLAPRESPDRRVEPDKRARTSIRRSIPDTRKQPKHADDSRMPPAPASADKRAP